MISLQVGEAIKMLNEMGAQDLEARTRSAALTGRLLQDSTVREKWLKVATEEKDDDLRVQMAERLAALGLVEGEHWILFLSDCIARPDRENPLLLQAIAHEAVRDEKVYAVLIELCKYSKSDSLKSSLLKMVVLSEKLPAEAVEFLRSQLPSMEQDAKEAVVRRLLQLKALSSDELSNLLDLNEHEEVQLLVLGYVVDNALTLNGQVLAKLLSQDPKMDCRMLAIRALCAGGAVGAESAKALIQALGDPHPMVRSAALDGLAFHLVLNADHATPL